MAHLDFDLIAPLLEERKILTSDEAAHVLRRARTLSKEHAVHELVRILAKSPFRSLRSALEQCVNSAGHKELLKELDRLVATDTESGMVESEPKIEQQWQSDINDRVLSAHDFQINWKQLSSMPVGMKNAQARVLGNKIYVGGGTTGMIDKSSKVYVYDCIYDRWETLSMSPVYNFALEVYNSSILLIGGRDTDSGEVTGEVFCWSQAEGLWKDGLLPSMPTARHSASSTTYGQYIVVAGGFAVVSPISKVEVYSAINQQWLFAQPLPQAQSHMKQVVASGNWMLTGGSGNEGGTHLAFSTSLEALISNAKEQPPLLQGMEEKYSIWRILPQVPHLYCSIACLGNLALVLGKEASSQTPIFAYNSDDQSWAFMNELPFSCQSSTTVSIPGGALVVLGGVTHDSSKNCSASNCVQLVRFQRVEQSDHVHLIDSVYSASIGRGN